MGYSEKSQRIKKEIDFNKTTHDGFIKENTVPSHDPRNPIWKLVIIDNDGNGEY